MQRPSALGMTLCDQIIIDRDTLKLTLVGILTGIACEQFPSFPQPIDVFVDLTDGQGNITLNLVVICLDTDEEIRNERIIQEFRNPLQVVTLIMRLRLLSFPTPGNYLFELQADGEAICHRRLRVYESEERT